MSHSPQSENQSFHPLIIIFSMLRTEHPLPVHLIPLPSIWKCFLCPLYFWGALNDPEQPMHLKSTWFGVEAAAKISLYCESVERRESQGRYPVILQPPESSMWKQQQLGDTEWYKHCSGKTTACMEGLSLSSFKREQKEVKHILGVLHPPLQWCGRKAGWTDSQNIFRLWRTFLLNSDERKPGVAPKPELVNSGVTFLIWIGPEEVGTEL